MVKNHFTKFKVPTYDFQTYIISQILIYKSSLNHTLSCEEFSIRYLYVHIN